MKTYCNIPIDVFNDKRLQSFDIALLSYLFFLIGEKRKIKIDLNHLENKFNIKDDYLKNKILRLKNLKWIILCDDPFNNFYNKHELLISLNIPEIESDPYCQPGSKIAKVWTRYFPGRMIKHDDVYELIDFVNNGMDEELVIEIMRYSSEKVKDGSPFHYTLTVLRSLDKKGILSIEDYQKEKEEKKGGLNNDQQISRNDRIKERRIKRKEFKKEKYR
ncbi:MAG: DnaD domain protein [bacterium]